MAEEYIKRKDAIKSLTGWYTKPTDRDIEWVLSRIPAADVVERKRGEWNIRRWHMASSNPYVDDTYAVKATCSRCNFCIDSARASFGYPNINTTNFCPNCGADMRSHQNILCDQGERRGESDATD